MKGDDDAQTVDQEWAREAATWPGDEPAFRPTPRQMALELRGGVRPTDRAFDQFLPPGLREVSGQHWTPLVVALRVAQWLDAYDITSVIDIGAGAGKLCVAAALTSKAHFFGLEQRVDLVAAAQALAAQFGVADRCQFIVGRLGACALPAAQAYYLYNPFGENLFGADAHIDDAVELSDARFARDVALARKHLAQAPVGTYVIEYNGFGGALPAGYVELVVDWKLPNVLRLSQKQA